MSISKKKLKLKKEKKEKEILSVLMYLLPFELSAVNRM